MDLSILSGIFKTLPCQECKQFTLALSENLQIRKGCASNLELHCQVCSWKQDFNTSAKISCFFEVNRRLVYAMRSVGCGGGAAARFCGLMNMPPIPRASPYSAHNKGRMKAANEVCQAEARLNKDEQGCKGNYHIERKSRVKLLIVAFLAMVLGNDKDSFH